MATLSHLRKTRLVTSQLWQLWRLLILGLQLGVAPPGPVRHPGELPLAQSHRAGRHVWQGHLSVGTNNNNNWSSSFTTQKKKICWKFKLRMAINQWDLDLPRDQRLSELHQEIIQDDVGVDCGVVRVGQQVGHHCLSHLNQGSGSVCLRREI